MGELWHLPLDLVSWVLLLGGCFFCVVGGLGLIRLPDFYSRMHAAGMTDTLGAGLLLVALAFQATHWMEIVKLFFILGFLVFTSPTAAHALARAAFTHGLKPKLAEPPPDVALAAEQTDTIAETVSCEGGVSSAS